MASVFGNNINLNCLVDADLIVYRCGFAADAEAKRKGLEHTDYEHIALGNVKATVSTILSLFPGGKEHKLYISGRTNFRDDAATIAPYKGNRDPTHKPKYYKEIKEYLVSQFHAKVVEGQEADDQIGIEQWAKKDKSSVIVSIDKDLDMIPGFHYNWVKKDLYYITLETANINFFKQLLTGDRVDNIPGLKGVGPKTADKIVKDCWGNLDKLRDRVKKEYQNQFKGKWEAAYREMGTLLWIRREENQECPLL